MPGPDSQCDLAGMRVLVTRPVRQASGLCALIEAWNGHAVRLPTLEIAAGGTSADRERLARAHDYDLLIFVSANAVEHAAPHLPHPLATTVAAVGRATAAALQRLGCTKVLTPAGRADSEALLSLPALQVMAGRRILIVRGEGGRALLGDTLAARGGIVDYAEIYRRIVPNSDPQTLLDRWPDAVDVVTVTSGEALANLCLILRDDLRLFATPLVVVSGRTADDARHRGFGHVIIASGAADEQVCKALCSLAGAHQPNGR
jgi:uroporphyrinogen-III synthase